MQRLYAIETIYRGPMAITTILACKLYPSITAYLSSSTSTIEGDCRKMYMY